MYILQVKSEFCRAIYIYTEYLNAIDSGFKSHSGHELCTPKQCMSSYSNQLVWVVEKYNYSAYAYIVTLGGLCITINNIYIMHQGIYGMIVGTGIL